MATQETTADRRAKIRDDLIRRLFAVAISVGAAATLAKMGWVQDGRWPCLHEWQELSILIAAMTATVLSWDGYLFAIADRPLRNFWRFAIDILLVFIYMFLLMTAHLLVWWLFLHALIFTLYAIWDRLSILDWMSKYYTKTPKDQQTAGRIYVGGLKNSEDVSRGPIITIVWGIYFWALYFLNLNGLNNRIFCTTLLVVFALWLYRKDKAERFTMGKRLIVVFALFLVSAAYVYWHPITDAAIWAWAGRYIGSASCAA